MKTCIENIENVENDEKFENIESVESIESIEYIYYVLSDRITPRLNDSRPKPRPCYFTSEASEV